MKKADKVSVDEMPEINLKRAKVSGVGEYFRRMAAEQRYVQLDTDLTSEFRDARSVNAALREYMKLRAVLQDLFKGSVKSKTKRTA